MMKAAGRKTAALTLLSGQALDTILYAGATQVYLMSLTRKDKSPSFALVNNVLTRLAAWQGNMAIIYMSGLGSS